MPEISIEALNQVRSLFKERSGLRRYAKASVEGFGDFWLRSLFDGEQRELSSQQWEEDEKGNRSVVTKYQFADRAIAMIVTGDGGEQAFSQIDREWLAEMDFNISSQVYEEMLKHGHEGRYGKDKDDQKKSSGKTPNSSAA